MEDKMEINNLKAQVFELKTTVSVLENSMKNFNTVFSSNFEKLFENMDRIKESLDGIHHLKWNVSIQEKEISDLKIEMAKVNQAVLTLNTAFVNHSTTQKTTIKTLYFVFAGFFALAGLIIKFVRF